jgi:chemotaxis protein methyltransferase CheR
MTPPADSPLTLRFRQLVSQQLGLVFDAARGPVLDEVLARRLARTGSDAAPYLAELAAADASSPELAELAEELTINETYFFRHMQQFNALAEAVLPERLAARADTRRLRLLSAACSTGEEALSMAIVLRERVPDLASWRVDLRGVDVNRAVLERARRGRYSAWSLRETPAELRARWFVERNGAVEVDESIRAMVSFEASNLAGEDPYVWLPDSHDVIFCRNALMYFSPEKQREAIRRMARALAPGGFLFLGHAETLRGLSRDFELVHTHGTFYYKRLPTLSAAANGPFAASLSVVAAPADPSGSGPFRIAPPAPPSSSWVDAIRDSAERVGGLSQSTSAPAPAPPPATDGHVAARADSLRRAHDLHAEERYADALALVDALPSQLAGDTQVALLRAVLLTDAGRFVDAEAACARLLAHEPTRAGASYLLALCREGAGDRARAREHDLNALYLDPGFAMARLHLGLLLRREGEPAAAKRELEQALFLLERDDEARLALYGGGFKRDALMRLCRAQLAACAKEIP